MMFQLFLFLCLTITSHRVSPAFFKENVKKRRKKMRGRPRQRRVCVGLVEETTTHQVAFVTGVSREGRIRIRLNLFVQQRKRLARRATSGFISNSPPIHIHMREEEDCVGWHIRRWSNVLDRGDYFTPKIHTTQFSLPVGWRRFYAFFFLALYFFQRVVVGRPNVGGA